jgi:hypothetical protein
MMWDIARDILEAAPKPRIEQTNLNEQHLPGIKTDQVKVTRSLDRIARCPF